GRLEVPLQPGDDVVGDRGGLAAQQPEEDDPDQGPPDGPADLLDGGQPPRGGAGVLAPDAGQHHVDQRGDHEPEPEAADQQGGDELPGVDRAAVVVDRPDQPGHAGDQQQRPGAEDPPPQGRGQADRRRRGQGRPDRERDPGDAGVQGAEPEADLEPQREDQEEGGDAHEKDAGHGQPGHERALAEQVEVDQGRPVEALLVPLVDGEGDQHGHGRGHGQEGPQRPAQVAPLDERVDEQQQPGGDDGHPDRVQPQRPGRPGLDQVAGRGGQGEDPDGHVDQEDGAPLEPEQVGLDQQPADQGAHDGGEPDGAPAHPEGASPLPGREGDLDDRENLGEHDRPEQPLEDPRADQHLRALGQPAQGGGEGEPGHADHEQALAAEDVAQAPAGDQHHRERELVTGQHPLDLGVGGVQVALDRGDGDVDDADVDQLHEAGGQHDGEGDPASGVGAAGGPPGLGGGGRGAHEQG